MQSNVERICTHITTRIKDVARKNQSPECCIFRVNEALRKVNEKAYVPEIVAIGPYHHGQESLQPMEAHKLLYLQSLLQWKKNAFLDKFINAVMEQEKELREYYAETKDLDKANLTEMMVLDGCFIIQLVRRFAMPELREENDLIFKMDWMLSSLQRDLVLLENQIPFPVLCKLFDMIEAPNQHHRLIYLLCRFISDLFPGLINGRKLNQVSAKNVKHVLELVHTLSTPSMKVVDSTPGRRDSQKGTFLSATQLRKNGVKFRASEAKRSPFEVEFRHGVLWMPTLMIEDRTECFLRNLMAYEQYSNHLPHYLFTDYMKFLGWLIDSPRDVEMLRGYGIIDNWLGDSMEVYNMFKKINCSITFPRSCSYYTEINRRVNAHCSTSLKGWIVRLIKSYYTTIK